VDTKYTS